MRIPIHGKILDSSDQINAEEIESFEGKVVDVATAAQTIPKRELEIAELSHINEQAFCLRNLNYDGKTDELFIVSKKSVSCEPRS